ncbi:Lrp/AsnC ligand binding domain-containing protein [Candidatus Woesearchaeota archaeon]|nr:Lrp/AsnC ligand binding domain-containing protein [Candidatus Woesearchaeota archaeon]
MVKAYVLLKVKAGSERSIVTSLELIKEVAEVNELYGDWDIISRLDLQKLEDLDRILTEKIRSIEGIENSSTMIVAEYIK